jgi:hypothetical protein
MDKNPSLDKDTKEPTPDEVYHKRSEFGYGIKNRFVQN